MFLIKSSVAKSSAPSSTYQYKNYIAGLTLIIHLSMYIHIEVSGQSQATIKYWSKFLKTLLKLQCIEEFDNIFSSVTVKSSTLKF